MSSTTRNWSSIALLLMMVMLLQGCGAEEKQAGPTPGYQAVAVLPSETPAAQVVASPTTAIQQTGPSPSPTEFGQVVVQTVTEQAVKTRAKHIDLVICLDVSGSMGPLIEAAKKKLMEIARDIKNLKQHPTLRIALLSYGSGISRGDGSYVIIESDFTGDLDLIFRKLSELRATGSIELVARVIAYSLDKLSWSRNPDTLKVIFVAGNETIHQDRNYTIEAVCQKAKEAHVIINTIYCAQYAQYSRYAGYTDKISTEWTQLAGLGKGKYSLITLKDAGMSPQLVVPSVFLTSMPPGFPPVTPKVTSSRMPVRPTIPAPSRAPQTASGEKTFEGQIVGVLNGTDVMVKNADYGGSTMTFRTDTVTRYSPPSRRPSSGDRVRVRYSQSQPEKARTIEFLN